MPLQDTDPTPSLGGFGLKLNMLNCLMFNTDFESWVTLKQSDGDGSEFEALLHRYGLDEGDYRCSEDHPLIFGLRVGVPTWETTIRHQAVCIRHDVAWNSLQEFADDPSNTDAERRIDSAWHPRNKFLADAVFLIEMECAGFRGLQRRQCLSDNPDFWEVVGKLGTTWARHRTKFVVEANDFAWPIAYQDVVHARQQPRYVVCDYPVPRASNLRLTQIGSSYRASWSFEPGCAVGLDDVRFNLKWVEPRTLSVFGVPLVVTGFDERLNTDVFPGASCSSTSTRLLAPMTSTMTSKWRAGSDVSLYIYIEDRHGGASALSRNHLSAGAT